MNKLKKLPNEEWKFDSIPDDEIWVCADWELGRTKILLDTPLFQHSVDWDDIMFHFGAPAVILARLGRIVRSLN